MDNVITEAYSQSGGDLPYFVGKQYGSGWLRTLARFAFPILKRVVGVATNTAEDVVMKNKPIGQSLRKNALNELGMNRRKRKHIPDTIYSKKRR